MMTTDPTVALANQARLASVIDQTSLMASMILAFNNDPIIRWMYPNPHQYLSHFANLVKALGEKAFDHNSAYKICNHLDGDIGAAFWLPPSVDPDFDGVTEHLQQSIFEPQQATVFETLEQMGEYHPHEPHWYLAFLGVEPPQKGKGLGSALIQPMLMR